MPGGDRVAGRLAEVRRRIARSAGRRDPDAIAIVAVTKGRPPESCAEALHAGLAALGENRVQEALPKMDRVAGAEWHLIGHLQRNKVRLAAGRFALIHSVDSAELAAAIHSRSPRQPVLLQVNVAREPAKHGVAPERALELAAEVAALLPLRGLMGMAARSPADPRPAFALLWRLREEAQQRLGRGLPVLSMGMSDDFEVAVEEGSTMLRVGRILFGET